jgi:hypothetical protein
MVKLTIFLASTNDLIILTEINSLINTKNNTFFISLFSQNISKYIDQNCHSNAYFLDHWSKIKAFLIF